MPTSEWWVIATYAPFSYPPLKLVSHLSRPHSFRSCIVQRVSIIQNPTQLVSTFYQLGRAARLVRSQHYHCITPSPPPGHSLIRIGNLQNTLAQILTL